MEIKIKNLSRQERKTLEQIIQVRQGDVTVRQAREFASHGLAMTTLLTIFVTLLLAALGVLFAPFGIGAAIAPIACPVWVLLERGKWLRILPKARDYESVELT